jgi:hypothetical protein
MTNKRRANSEPACVYAGLLRLGPPSTVPWPALQVHHRQDPHCNWSEGIEDGIGKAGNEPATHGAADRLTGFGMLDNRGAAAFDLAQERRTQA